MKGAPPDGLCRNHWRKLRLNSPEKCTALFYDSESARGSALESKSWPWHKDEAGAGAAGGLLQPAVLAPGHLSNCCAN